MQELIDACMRLVAVAKKEIEIANLYEDESHPLFLPCLRLERILKALEDEAMPEAVVYLTKGRWVVKFDLPQPTEQQVKAAGSVADFYQEIVLSKLNKLGTWHYIYTEKDLDNVQVKRMQ